MEWRCLPWGGDDVEHGFHQVAAISGVRLARVGDESVCFLADGEETFTGGVVVGLDALAGVPEVGCLAASATYFI